VYLVAIATPRPSRRARTRACGRCGRSRRCRSAPPPAAASVGASLSAKWL
jgi:hypothetical protein